MYFVSVVQPALSAYQRHLHHDIHGPDEPLPETLAKRLKSGMVDPLNATTTYTPLPQLPDLLLEKQKSLTELREMSPRPQSHVRVQPYPPIHQAPTTVTGNGDIRRITSLSPRRKSHVWSVIRMR